MRFTAALMLLLSLASSTCAQQAEEELARYIARPEPAYGWQLVSSQRIPGGTEHRLALTSQEWQGITWKHNLQIFEPARLENKSQVLLLINSGSIGEQPTAISTRIGSMVARSIRARVVILSQVPNQPLLGNRVEDDLISETWLRYLSSKDSNWPLLFPMTKSAVKSMDAVSEFVKQQSGDAIDGFVLTGASKRGWTTWLAPAVDDRILAIAPIVIDVLNFTPQMQKQLDSWGEFSEQIQEYTSKGLVKLENETDLEVRLRVMMDPHTYLDRITIPKLIVIATNDRYWVIDSLNVYWDDLQGSKHVVYIPNADHSLGKGVLLALKTISAFFQQVTQEASLPEFQWQHLDEGDNYRLTVTAPDKPRMVRLWSAHSANLDFREARWSFRPVRGRDGVYSIEIPRPDSGHVAFYGELVYRNGPIRYTLSTQVRRE
jgi:PhoPQ-activated pathogenicity-related protein